MKHKIVTLYLLLLSTFSQAQSGSSTTSYQSFQPPLIADNPRLGYFAELTKWNLLRKNPIYWCMNCTEEFPFASAFGSSGQDFPHYPRPIHLIDCVPVNLNEPYATLQNFECIGSQVELGAIPHYSFLSRQDLDVMPYSRIEEIVRSITNTGSTIQSVPLHVKNNYDQSMMYVVDGVVIAR
ncbi:MAG: hypothetical protein IAE95_02865 [Chitinophagaceae bacterium]|nr:hypothetical protein [Chitinophagaceae bacterium]